MARFLLLTLLLAPACADGTVGSKGDGDEPTNGDETGETDDSDVPLSDHAATVAFQGSGLATASPGEENVSFGTFVVTSSDAVELTLRALSPTVYVADDAGASSGWHESHQGNVWAKDHLASCRLQGQPNADLTFDEEAPNDEGKIPYEGEYAIAPVADADTATDTGFLAVQAFDVVCDFTATPPADGLAAFAVDLRDASSVDIRDADGLSAPVTITADNGDPPQLYVSLSG